MSAANFKTNLTFLHQDNASISPNHTPSNVNAQLDLRQWYRQCGNNVGSFNSRTAFSNSSSFLSNNSNNTCSSYIRAPYSTNASYHPQNDPSMIQR